MGQKDNLRKYAPAGLLESLGGSLNLGSLGITGDAARTIKATATQGRGFMRTVLPFILILLAALLGFYFFRGNKGPTVADTQKETGTPTLVAIEETAQSIYNVGEDLVGRTVAGFENLGNFIRHRLSTGRDLIIPEFGIESKLIGFIESNNPVTKELWFDFDRILFETGSATLKPESMGQITNIAEIMKAFPNVHLKIGGYTDNVGDPAANLKLSQARAEAVRAMIIRQDINASRLTAEGYGEQHPVASNDTEQGRAKNRRVAARVTQK
jgi:outer membrane protein OmpA-like peptidoglycan-associated protein